MSLVAASNTNSLSFGLLPVETLDLIISHYVKMAPRAASDPMNCADMAFLLLNSYKDLLNLRLVSKSWASAVIPFAYKSVYLEQVFEGLLSDDHEGTDAVANMLDTSAIPMDVLIIHGSKEVIVLNESNSIKSVLESTPHLESLSISCGSLKPLDIKPGSLPNLTHLWLRCHSSNLNAFGVLCHCVKQSVKLLECIPTQDRDLAGPIILSFREHLESFFMVSIPYRLPHSVAHTHFP
ncbi:uncharacterized protein MELLADRAFT_102612 [Melampsora larici-populina 98AG31]|uniref:F-box domain-containing protein n=1 Tax=Melampsora larici-populina (strain 98AG31 / pathotype 3-4-7) TaxID=747676 RepID=F4R8U1_MELLP|nr:uncharacterized protein MELLADRAFT_102612 [Melampsora larici-populina 98AG31]EGG11271.1 hypothetical protein MELLADRAFT_102612 [Melampsora larici-populina 98AG31]